ncbi:hypothetical protein [Rubinisphaera margarita]|uniref:hypothetical protein n=1 Tax=Rubinisphaera margarita TaxID=2909586 RepID=UPI001EE8041E|nr:hypothetical protein [Rubinisphaera margarita]MCG6157903.1 hypothetical protein [Rubinisphaera margarita]
MAADDDVFRPEGEEPRRSERGCGMNCLLLGLAGIGAAMLLCCCGVGISLYSLAPTIDEDPQIAGETLNDLIDIELPEDYSPQMSASMNLMGMGNVRGAVVEVGENEGALIIVGMQGRLAQDERFMNQVRESLRERVGNADYEVTESETRQVTIDGQEVEFTFSKGRTKASEGEEAVDIRAVSGLLPGNGGEQVVFLLFMEESKWDEAEALQMLESIDLPEGAEVLPAPRAQPRAREDAAPDPVNTSEIPFEAPAPAGNPNRPIDTEPAAPREVPE